MEITIVGLGLIGGSIGLDLSSQMNIRVLGVEHNIGHANKALELGLVSQLITLECALKRSDIIILAIPVDQIEVQLAGMLDKIHEGGILIDLGSTKEKICDSVRQHPKRSQYVSAHPLAGTEFSGPQAAVKGLFLGKKNIICEKSLSSDSTLKLALKMFESVGLTTHFMNPKDHDKHLAYVSHLSHVTSFVLGLTVLDIEKDEKQILNLAGTGFASTVRLAKSNPTTWASIFEKNSDHLVDAIDRYLMRLEEFRSAVIDQNQLAMQKLIQEANVIKRILH